MKFNEQTYGFIVCQNIQCAEKIGIFSLDGIKCQSCVQTVTPAFQFFRKNIKVKRVYEQINAVHRHIKNLRLDLAEQTEGLK